MSGHTPGPWAVWPMGDLWAVTCTGSGKAHAHEGMHVAHVSMPNEQHQQWVPQRLSDAHLIAAAPELLEMLLALECDINTMVYCYDKRPENFWRAMQVAKENVILARAVIAKAKGEAL